MNIDTTPLSTQDYVFALRELIRKGGEFKTFVSSGEEPHAFCELRMGMICVEMDIPKEVTGSYDMFNDAEASIRASLEDELVRWALEKARSRHEAEDDNG